jgi:serine/threonine protein kinase
VHVGDYFHSGRYQVIHKLGHGGFSTVWLCQDTQHHTPKYVAIKIVTAYGSQGGCRELLIAERLRELHIEQFPGGQYLSLPLGSFRLTGPNGYHMCLVYPVMGPRLDIVSRILADEQDPDEYHRDMRQLLHQVVQTVAALHSREICHGGRVYGLLYDSIVDFGD